MKCKGCGALIQATDSSKKGYSPKLDAKYCQRCYRIRHYDDLMSVIDTSISNNVVLEEISKLDSLVLWVVDLFDFDSNMISSINRYIDAENIILVGSKRDLLPVTLANKKLSYFIFNRLAAENIQVKGIVVVGDYAQDGRDELLKIIKKYRNDRNVLVMGLANAGKSTLINALVGDDTLTIARYPGTTLDFVSLQQTDYELIDSPGLNNNESTLWHLSPEALKVVMPKDKIKPQVYQIKESQSFAISGIARVDIITDSPASIVFYCANTLSIHRGKVINADALWKDHYGTLLTPTLNDVSSMKKKIVNKRGNHFDVVIAGLGWLSVKGHINEISVTISEDIAVTSREAMI